jgi:hypothetical protein
VSHAAAMTQASAVMAICSPCILLRVSSPAEFQEKRG